MWLAVWGGVLWKVALAALLVLPIAWILIGAPTRALLRARRQLLEAEGCVRGRIRVTQGPCERYEDGGQGAVSTAWADRRVFASTRAASLVLECAGGSISIEGPAVVQAGSVHRPPRERRDLGLHLRLLEDARPGAEARRIGFESIRSGDPVLVQATYGLVAHDGPGGYRTVAGRRRLVGTGRRPALVVFDGRLRVAWGVGPVLRGAALGALAVVILFGVALPAATRMPTLSHAALATPLLRDEALRNFWIELVETGRHPEAARVFGDGSFPGALRLRERMLRNLLDRKHAHETLAFARAHGLVARRDVAARLARRGALERAALMLLEEDHGGGDAGRFTKEEVKVLLLTGRLDAAARRIDRAVGPQGIGDPRTRECLQASLRTRAGDGDGRSTLRLLAGTAEGDRDPHPECTLLLADLATESERRQLLDGCNSCERSWKLERVKDLLLAELSHDPHHWFRVRWFRANRVQAVWGEGPVRDPHVPYIAVQWSGPPGLQRAVLERLEQEEGPSLVRAELAAEAAIFASVFGHDEAALHWSDRARRDLREAPPTPWLGSHERRALAGHAAALSAAVAAVRKSPHPFSPGRDYGWLPVSLSQPLRANRMATRRGRFRVYEHALERRDIAVPLWILEHARPRVPGREGHQPDPQTSMSVRDTGCGSDEYCGACLGASGEGSGSVSTTARPAEVRRLHSQKHAPVESRPGHSVYRALASVQYIEPDAHFPAGGAVKPVVPPRANLV